LLGQVEGVDLDAQPRQRLGHLHADGTQADHCHPGRQVGLLEEVVAGEQARAQVAPGLGDDRPRTGRDDDLLGAQAAALDLQRLGRGEASPTGEVALAQFAGGLQGAAHEVVAQALDPGQRRRDVHAQELGAADAEIVEHAAAMEGGGGLDQDLGGHAADAGAGRPVGAGVDQDEVLGVLADLAQGGQARGAGAEDRDVVGLMHADLLLFKIGAGVGMASMSLADCLENCAD